MSIKIHPSVILNAGVEIDEGVEIGPYSIIGEDVRIGRNTFIGPHCVIEYTELGAENHIVASAFLGTSPQDFHYRGEKTKLIMGNNNIIREGVSIHRGTASGFTLTGNNCMFMGNSHVAHDCRIGDHVVVANSAGIAGHVEIGDHAFVSALLGIHQFVRIGQFAMLGAGAMVSLDIPPYCIAQGDRASLVGLNLVGLRRGGFSRDTIGAIKKAYKVVFLSGLTLKEALEEVKSVSMIPEVENFVTFCENSKRGIARPRMKQKERS